MSPDARNQPEELSFEVDDLAIKALAWGPADGLPVLALHGWLDHADSFQLMAPKLTGCRVIAVDLPGHGDSAHIAGHAAYYIWADLPAIRGVLDRLAWDRCFLLGHSRGAIISNLFAAACPERVTGVVALDSLLPRPVPDEQVVKQMRLWLTDIDRLSRAGERYFRNSDHYVEQRRRAASSAAAAEKLVPRGTETTNDGLRLKSDARLRAASPIKLNAGQIDTILSSIEAPVLAIWAESGVNRARWLRDLDTRARELCAHYLSKTFPGDHHFHLHEDTVGAVVEEVMAFLRKTPR